MPTEPVLLAALQVLWTQPVHLPIVLGMAGPGARSHEAGDQGAEHERSAPDAAPGATEWDWFEQVAETDRAYLLGPRWIPDPCTWCGGRLSHHRLCVTLGDDWAVSMPFGKHKGKPVRNVERRYLTWVLRSRMTLAVELREEIERVLQVGAPRS